MSLYIALFLAGILTILLPCILPLLPIVLGVSIAGRNPLRPLLTVAGMVISFVGFTLLLQLVLSQFVAVADYVRLATFYVLLLFGAGFLFHARSWQWIVAVLGALFFLEKGGVAVGAAALLGVVVLEVGGRMGGHIQQAGTEVHQKARSEFGADSPLTAFLIGLTLGMIWVPCAGPALGFVFALLREASATRAAVALFAYAAGTALPLLLIGYGGQRAVHSVRVIAPYTGRIKKAAGAMLMLTAVALHFNWFIMAQIWLLDHTSLGDIGTRLEDEYFGEQFEDAQRELRPPASPASPASSASLGSSSSAASDTADKNPSTPLRTGARAEPAGKNARSESTIALPKLSRAPEFAGLGQWFNSAPLTMAGLQGKVVLVDFWTYSCINCIRTLPYIQKYWEMYGSTPLTTSKFVLIGIHSPEFVFEKSAENVREAIERHGLTYPIAQDNDFATWRAFANHYWPAKYLIDAEGSIRYTHFGEGEYDETDRAIRSLLLEAGAPLPDQAMPEEGSSRRKALTSETYLGERSLSAYVEPSVSPLPLHHYTLVGDWELLDGERRVLRSDQGEIRMRFLGGEINLVLGSEEGTTAVSGTVTIDGRPIQTITVDHDDLYNLFTGSYGEHELILRLSGKGVEAYAFTFGAGA